MPPVLDLADHHLAEFAAAHHSIFTVADARAAGLSHGQIDRRVAGLWTPVHEGIFRMPGTNPTLKGSLLAACWAASKPRGVSHRSAAALYELPGGRDDLIEITCKRWLRTRRGGVIVHESTRVDESDIHEVDGLPVMRPERVVLELAGIRASPRYVETVIQAARRKRLITYDSMLATFNRHARRGLRGVRVLRFALEQWDPTTRATESEMETLLIQVLRDGGIAEPTPQFEISDASGRLIARVDAALPSLRIAIEYDSKQEHSDEFQLARDASRRNRIAAAGWTHLSARHHDLLDGGGELIHAITSAARRA
jgi:very-short-patch-repair endonuclease